MTASEKAKAEVNSKSMDFVIKQTIKVGGYRLGTENGSATLHLPVKPKWIHRKMMKIFFGVDWVDATK
jgi:hypothetical protein